MQAFVIRAFNTKSGSSGKKIDFENVHQKLIKPALDQVGLSGGTTGEIIDAGDIREDIFSLIIEADLVLCDITIHNANVFYELGIRHALRKRSTVLIKGVPGADTPPFDIITDRYLEYNPSSPAKKVGKLVQVIRETLDNDRQTDSPVFKLLPALAELDPASVQVLPKDLADEIARARDAESKGWLRLLASEVKGLRFEWPALRAIGAAQWHLGDVEGAAMTWQYVRNKLPRDVTANLALANVFERRFQKDRRQLHFEDANRALNTVLATPNLGAAHRVEALALLGRNLKTRWRQDFQDSSDLEQRRHAATNPIMIDSFKAYYEAYLANLNHFYSGLAAWQMGHITLDLAAGAAWEDLFGTAEEAADARDDIRRDVAALQSSVKLAIKARREQVQRENATDIWAEVSHADALFLTAERDQQVVRAYRDSGLDAHPSARDSAKRQLCLFATLGINADRAQNAIAEIDARAPPPEPDPDLHVFVAVGHRVDEQGRPVPRFPPEKEQLARQLLEAEIQALKQKGRRVRAFVSGAPGTDIIVHEICKALAIEAELCLPMPRDAFSAFAFRELDDWRRRFLQLVKDRQPLCLSDQQGLPKWLKDSTGDPWERGNRWVFEMAQASGARSFTLIALWDRADQGDARGGTADMVRIARAKGDFDVKVIDSRQLL